MNKLIIMALVKQKNKQLVKFNQKNPKNLPKLETFAE
jgi:hypothetical protein